MHTAWLKHTLLLIAVEHPEYRQLRVLPRFYEEIDKEIILVKSRLHNALQLTFPEIYSLFPSKNSALYLNVLLLFPHPAIVLSCSRTVLKNQLLANTKKNLSSERALRKAEALMHLAHTSYPAVGLRDATVSKVRYYADKLIHLLAKKQEMVEEMEAIASSLPEYDILRQIPGVGSSSAVRFIAETGDFRQAERELNAYAGIDIRSCQSGKTFYSDHINKRGNPKLRKLLYLMIQNMLKKQQNTPNHIVHYYYKQKEEPYNKYHKVASVACINKLLKTIHYLIKTNQMYDYRLATTL
ncbi:transposase [Listeria rocourtiae]|nr:transposase [Listeria rocourtiae]